MKVTFGIKELSKAIGTVSAAVQSKSALPVLAYLKLSVRGGKAELTGSDMGLSIITAVKVESGEDGVVLLPSKATQEILGTLRGDFVTLTIDDTNVSFSSGKKSQGKRPTLPASQFPTPEAMPAQTFGISLVGIKKVIGCVEAAVPSKEGKFVQPVILLESDGTKLRGVATDGHRIAIADFLQATPTLAMKIPASAIPTIKSLGGDTVTFGESETNYFFQTPEALLIVRKSSGVFPDYRKAVMGTVATKVTGSADELKSALARLIPFMNPEPDSTKGQSYTADFLVGEGDGTELQLTTQEDPGYGSASDVAEMKTSGAKQSIYLNPKFVLDFLNNANGEVVIEMTSHSKPVRFSNGETYQYLIMPVPAPAVKA